jgi:hypothetical protein
VVLTQLIAASVLRFRCPRIDSAGAALESWKSLPLELSANVNPFIGISQSAPLPANLEPDYYPADKETILLGDYSATLDVLGIDNEDLRNARRTIETLRQGHVEERVVYEARIWFTQAGHKYFGSDEHTLALRCYLNACRLEPPVGDILTPEMRCNIGKCLLHLGDFQNAGVEFLLAAEKYRAKEDSDSAAECFERTTLCWEAMNNTPRYELGTDSGLYDSTECSRKAKYLYLSIGDYVAAARCAILEQDCIMKWQDAAASVPRRIMRWIWLYGESPMYVLRTLLLLLMGAGVSFFYGGYKNEDEIINYDMDSTISWQGVEDFGNAIYLAAVTTSTLGYGDLSPAYGLSKMIASITSFSGIIVASMFIVAIQRRYVGR